MVATHGNHACRALGSEPGALRVTGGLSRRASHDAEREARRDRLNAEGGRPNGLPLLSGLAIHSQPAPDQVAPDHVALDHVALDHVALDHVALDQVALDQVALDQVALDQVADDHVAPDQVAPDQVAPDQVALDQVAPDQVAELKVPPLQVALASSSAAIVASFHGLPKMSNSPVSNTPLIDTCDEPRDASSEPPPVDGTNT